MKAENSRSPQRRAHTAPLRRKLIAVLVAACYTGAQAAPVNPSVVAGQASFNLQGKTYSITNTPNTIINWQSFSVAADEITRFIQQSADSKVLNRITGQSPTQILGSLQSNGKVFLINPNGVLFGAGSRVDVNGLVASSLAISNADFLAGKNNFSGDAAAGKVSNAGTITTPAGGQIFLVAPAVENSGVISAPNGDVVLAAGHSVQLFYSKDPNVQVVVSAPLDQALNLGQIVAQGGRVGVYGALVSQRGGINANSAVRGANGQIILKSSGTTLLEAGSSTSATGSNLNTGGDIQVLGPLVGLTGNAVVDASGAAGGGTVLVGGDYQGKNPAVQNARQAYVGKDSVIKADATGNGDGGKVIVWSDQATQMFGSISARGGAAGGNGGFVETSGHYLDMQGTVDTRAPNGATGKLLLDPSDMYIADGDHSVVSGVPNSVGNLNLVPRAGAFLESGTVQDSLLLTSVLQTALLASDVTVSTGNVHGSSGGDISVLSAITLPSGRTLSLTADHDIMVKAAVTGTGGNLNLTATGNIALQAALSTGGLALSAGSNSSITATDSVTVNGIFNLQAGNWSQVGTLPNFSAADFRIAGGSHFVRAVSGDGATSPYHLVDVYGLQGAGALLGSYSYVLDNDIDASKTAHWNLVSGSTYSGFKPFGGIDYVYTGTFDGNHKTISGLYINRPTTSQVGLISNMGAGTIKDVKLSGGSVEGNNNTGALVRNISPGGTVSGVAIEIDVTGNGANIGGLAGYSNGAISNSYALGNVTGKTSSSTGNTGGLLGYNGMYGTLNATYSSGAVKSNCTDVVNALVGAGANGGAVTGSFFQTTGATSDSAGAVGLTSEQMQQQASFSGFDFDGSSSVWRMYEGHTMPLLRGFLTPITITGGGANKVYDAIPFVYSPAFSHADIYGTLSYADGVNAGTHKVDGLYSTKYDVIYDASTSLIITPRHITATVTGASKTYDRLTSLVQGTSDGTYSISYGNTVNGDTPGISGTFNFASKTAGTSKTITVTSPTLTNNPHGNYALDVNEGGNVTGTGTINQAKLPLSGLSATGRTYDGTTGKITLNGTASVTPIYGDDVALTGTIGTATLENKSAGASKLVIVGLGSFALSGDDASNYLLVSPSNLMTDIAKAPLTVGNVTANNRVYNMDWNPAASQYGTLATLNVANGALTGVLGSDVVTVTAGSGTFDSRNVGTGKNVMATGFTLGGTDGGNYMVTGMPSGLTANITPATLTVTLASRQYNNSASATLSG